MEDDLRYIGGGTENLLNSREGRSKVEVQCCNGSGGDIGTSHASVVKYLSVTVICSGLHVRNSDKLSASN